MITNFEYTLPSGEKVKFSIWRSKLKNDECYFAKIVKTDTKSYQKLSGAEKQKRFGAIVRDENHKTVYYKDLGRLKSDLITHYGRKQLRSE
jgi:hypothetical protein